MLNALCCRAVAAVSAFCGRTVEVVRKVASSPQVRQTLGAVAITASTLMFGASMACATDDPVTLPTSAVNVAGTIDALVAQLNPVVKAAFLAFAMYLAVKIGRRFLSRSVA